MQRVDEEGERPTISVCLHISCSSLDIWRRHISLRGSQNLVANEEAGQVVVLVENIHDSLVSLELALVPLRLRHARSLDVRVEGVQVEPDVDAGVGEGLHAGIMVGARIDVVDADGVGSEGFHQVGIASALFIVDERVVRQKLIGDACWGTVS
jgi:hypothetical protein